MDKESHSEGGEDRVRTEVKEAGFDSPENI